MKRLNKIIDQHSDAFNYTQKNGILTAKQRKFYEENGYIVIKRLLNKSEIVRFYNRFDELVTNPKERPKNLIVMRDVSLKNAYTKENVSNERIVTKLQNWSQDKVLWKYAMHPNIIKYVESIIGSDIRAHHFMCINKPQDPGQLSSRHPLHQDQYAFPFLPSNNIVCSWTALQKINRNNGCLCVIPGTHKINLLPHSYPKQWIGPVNKGYHGIQYDGDINTLLRQRIHLHMDEGDTVFFHPLLIHGSGANVTNKNRRSISVHYCNSKLVKFVKDGYVIPQQSIIATEVEATLKKLTGKDIKYKDYWKIKSRQVKGNIGEWKL
eukprot:258638_1